MKAIRVHEFGGAEQLKLEEVPDLKPGTGEVLITIKAAGVNPVDTYIRTGTYSLKPSLPYTPGFDAAGVVQAVGKGVEGFTIGDRVYTARSITGTYAEQCLCESKNVRCLPGKIGFPEGAALGVPYPTAYRALFQLAKALPREAVLVHGASGGVGIAAVQFARAHGMFVIGTASTEKGRDLVLANGAHRAIDHSGPGIVEEVLRLTDGAGVNVIIEMLANKNLQTDLSMLAHQGRVLVVGNRGSTEVNMRQAMARDATIRGMVILNASDVDLNTIHAALFAALEAGVARPVVSQQFKLNDAAAAHEAVMKPGMSGKIVLIP